MTLHRFERGELKSGRERVMRNGIRNEKAGQLSILSIRFDPDLDLYDFLAASWRR